MSYAYRVWCIKCRQPSETLVNFGWCPWCYYGVSMRPWTPKP